MTIFLSNILNYYLYELWQDFGDKRMKNFKLFSDGPYIVITILCVYLLSVLKILPNYMKNRKPFKIKALIRCFNVLMILIHVFYFIFEIKKLNYGLELLDFSIPSDEEISPEIEHELKLHYFYHIKILIELFVTVFFVLRKKDRQMNFYHLYHHFIIAFGSWLAIWFRFNSKPIKLFILLNSFEHAILYSYYTFSTFGPKIQDYLIWKKLTLQLQCIQFLILVIYGVITKLLGIQYPKILYNFAITNVVLFLLVYTKLYINSYSKTKKIL